MSDDKKGKLSVRGQFDKQGKNPGGQIRQSFSHGRSKVVTVEVKKKRSVANNKPEQGDKKLDKASMLARKTGLTNTELENRIKAVQELAARQVMEAKRRAESANVAISSRLTNLEAEKAAAMEKQAAIEAKKKEAAAALSAPVEAPKLEKPKENKALPKPSERSENRGNNRRSEKGGSDKNDRQNRNDRQGDRNNRRDRDDRGDRRSSNRQDREGRPENRDRFGGDNRRRGDRNDRNERNDRNDRGDRNNRGDRNDRGFQRRPGERSDRPENRSQFANRGDRPQQNNRPQTSRITPTDADYREAFNANYNDSKRPVQRKSYSNADKKFDDEENSSPVKNQKNGMQIKRDRDEILNRSMERQGRISIYNALDEDDNDSFRRSGAGKKSKSKAKPTQTLDDGPKVVREIAIPETITVQELSNRMAVRVSDLIKSLMKMGIMATINQVIDADTAELVVLEMGHKVKRVGDLDIVSELIKEVVDDEADLLPRPPIVTIMGHVDHGKTSLLDAIRKTDVALNEAGGITQHIGAYQITMKDSRKITFIDTPGHAAFTEMRARGANVTDVVVLVVAADDGVKEQTVEALNHAKAAGVPIVIAINKIDKPGADPNRVRNDLLQYGIVVESLGGDVIDVEVSAKSSLNLDLLEDSILLQSDILELKANPNRTAEATVVEAKVEKGLGPVATVLVNKGTLRVGDIFVSGMVYGKVRAIRNDLKQNLKELLPGAPGEIIGFNNAPIPGDDFVVVSDESKAKEIADIRARKKKEKEWVVKKGSASDVFAQIAAGDKLQSLSVIIKADTQGSIEAISDSLRKLATDEICVNILHSGVGGITENDVILANASNAVVLGFNVRANAQAKDQSLRDGIEIKYYSIIYDLIDDIKAIMSGMLSPILSERVIGSAEVRQIFDISKVGKIAGCMVTDGVIRRTAKVRVLRDSVVIHTGDVKSINRKKDSVKEVKEGFECGVSLESYSDIHLKDVLEFFEIDEIARSL